jgi:RNA polymerase sigma-70 factor, ECF subfamily
VTVGTPISGSAGKSNKDEEAGVVGELDLICERNVMPNLIARQRERNLSEEEAITQARRGDGAAFEYLYKAYSRRVYGLCLRMTKNPAEAEDLTQQAFLQVFRKIGTFRGEAGFSTWLYRVTVNVVLMHRRRKKPTEVLAESWNPAETDGGDSREPGAGNRSMLGAIDRLNLKRAIGKLPSGYRRFFLLHDVVGYQHNEIAGLLGCSIGCSKSQLHRARKRLRHLLQGEQWRSESAAAPA